MKKVVDKENYVFIHNANYISYPKFIKELLDSYNYIKQQYPDIKDEDIIVEFETTNNHIPMKLTYFVLETDEEYNTRIALEKISKENMRKYKIQELKKFLKENPELKEEFLNS